MLNSSASSSIKVLFCFPEKLLFQLIRLEVLLTGGLSLLRAERCGSEENEDYNFVQYIPGIQS